MRLGSPACVCQGDKLINPVIGVYIPILRIPFFKGGDEFIPNVIKVVTCVCLVGDVFFTDFTMVNQHFSPAFGE